MLKKHWCIVLAVLALAQFQSDRVSAAGHGVVVSHPHGGAPAECRSSGQFSRAENGIVGPFCGYGNGYWSWGGAGYGWGLGYGYPGWGYDLVGVPYFAQFPPVYYGYSDNMPVLKTPMPPSWTGSEGPQPVVDSSASASPPRPPLRIINPYYMETK